MVFWDQMVLGKPRLLESFVRFCPLIQVMQQLRDSGMTMVVVSHEMRFAQDAADRVVFMSEGKIVEEGTPSAIFEAPQQKRTQDFVSEISR